MAGGKGEQASEGVLCAESKGTWRRNARQGLVLKEESLAVDRGAMSAVAEDTLQRTEERRPQGGRMTDLRKIYLTPKSDLNIDQNTSRNWPKSWKNWSPFLTPFPSASSTLGSSQNKRSRARL